MVYGGMAEPENSSIVMEDTLIRRMVVPVASSLAEIIKYVEYSIVFCRKSKYGRGKPLFITCGTLQLGSEAQTCASYPSAPLMVYAR
jgi:hypothetical protein